MKRTSILIIAGALALVLVLFFATRNSFTTEAAPEATHKALVVVCDLYSDNTVRVIVPADAHFNPDVSTENCADTITRALNGGYANPITSSSDADVRYLLTK